MNEYLKYVTQNCITALNELCIVNEQLRAELAPDAEGDVNRTGALNRMIQDYIVIKVASLFDEDGRTISFRTVFPNNQRVKEIKSEEIMRSIKTSRDRCVAHSDQAFVFSEDFLMPTADICTSNLGHLLEELDSLLDEE